MKFRLFFFHQLIRKWMLRCWWCPLFLRFIFYHGFFSHTHTLACHTTTVILTHQPKTYSEWQNIVKEKKVNQVIYFFCLVNLMYICVLIEFSVVYVFFSRCLSSYIEWYTVKWWNIGMKWMSLSLSWLMIVDDFCKHNSQI